MDGMLQLQVAAYSNCSMYQIVHVVVLVELFYVCLYTIYSILIHFDLLIKITRIFVETFLQSFDTMIPLNLKKKIYKLEIFDEMEEWNLLMAHYCFTVATKGSMMSDINMKCAHSTEE